MIKKIVLQLEDLVSELVTDINLDIIDVRKSNHENLLTRNSKKLDCMDKLSLYKMQLNEELSNEFQKGTDITIYKNDIDNLEIKLKELYYLNGKLASIVLPVREMYKDIIDEITAVNGGSLIEVMA